MLDPELPDRRTIVIANLFLLGIKAHALSDYGMGLAGMTPDGEGHFEADGLRAVLAERPRRTLLVQPVAGRGTFELRRDVASHVEALHLSEVDSGPSALRVSEWYRGIGDYARRSMCPARGSGSRGSAVHLHGH